MASEKVSVETRVDALSRQVGDVDVQLLAARFLDRRGFCPKDETRMIRTKTDSRLIVPSAPGMFGTAKADLIALVCTTCGHVEFRTNQPEQFRRG